MSRSTLLGLLFVVGGLVILLFQSISSMMGTEIVWKTLALVDVLDPKYLSWLEGASWYGIEKALNYLVTMPLFILSISIGVLIFLLGSFRLR